jgi:hypothetical protein
VTLLSEEHHWLKRSVTGKRGEPLGRRGTLVKEEHHWLERNIRSSLTSVPLLPGGSPLLPVTLLSNHYPSSTQCLSSLTSDAPLEERHWLKRSVTGLRWEPLGRRGTLVREEHHWLKRSVTGRRGEPLGRRGPLVPLLPSGYLLLPVTPLFNQ